MKRTLLSALLLSSGLAGAFEGLQTVTTKRAGVQHTLKLSHWAVDRKGVPSFDYAYEQQAGACKFRLAGHAVGLVEEVGGKVELVVFNPEDEKGRELPQIVTFASGDVYFSLPYKGRLNKVGLMSTFTPAVRSRACDKGDEDRFDMVFRK